MKVDGNGTVAPFPGAASSAGLERGERWLAQLELAYLGTLHRDTPLPQREGEQARGGDARAMRAADAPVRVDCTSIPAPATTPMPAWGGLSVAQAVLLPGAPVPPPEGPYAQVAPTRSPADATASEGAGAALAAALPDGTGGRGGEAPAPGVSSAPGKQSPLASAPPRYAKQFMQLSLADPGQAQASVRDASLSGAAAAAVARDVAGQLRSEGVALQRVFVNGRRFDADALGAAIGEPAPFKNHTQE